MGMGNHDRKPNPDADWDDDDEDHYPRWLMTAWELQIKLASLVSKPEHHLRVATHRPSNKPVIDRICWRKLRLYGDCWNMRCPEHVPIGVRFAFPSGTVIGHNDLAAIRFSRYGAMLRLQVLHIREGIHLPKQTMYQPEHARIVEQFAFDGTAL